jgi:hypothetical protein
MPRRSKPFRKLRKRLGKLWARIQSWSLTARLWCLDMAEDALIGCMEAVHRGQDNLGRGDAWPD